MPEPPLGVIRPSPLLGSHDTHVAVQGAELFLKGWAPLVLFCGGRGRLTEDWGETEARVFARIARDMGE